MKTAALIALLLIPLQDKKKRAPSMDYGPFLCASFILKPDAKFDNKTGAFDGPVVARGIAIRLADDWSVGAIFDMDTLRVAALWKGAPLKFRGVIFDGGHGPSPTLGIEPAGLTPDGPGWAKDGSFEDPRPDSIPPLPRPGPLPSDWAKYRGLYVHGRQVVVSYTVGTTAVLESLSLEGEAFVRTFRVGPSDAPMRFLVHSGPGTTTVTTVKAPPGLAHISQGAYRSIELKPNPAPSVFKVIFGDEEAVAEAKQDSPDPVDLSELVKGGPGRFPDVIETQGGVSLEKTAYVVDRLSLPEKNPWNAKMRVGGFDFFRDGQSAAVCTWDGDVWVVKGIDDGLEKLSWKRFATGLHQPLGLKIVDDVVYTVGHDQLTRFHDFNGDGEADFHENFNNDWELTTAFHAFAFDLHTDPQGNFVFAFGSPVRSGGGGFHRITRHHGSILKVSKDGSTLEAFATGFRAPNGIGVGPNGEVTSGDNEGTWVPKCPLHWVAPGSFNGVMDTAHREVKQEAPRPICWMPKNVDNSGGGQVWVTSDRWGPFQGELLHMSYGTSSLYKVLMEDVGGVRQGGVVKLPVRFTSSAMRARFNPRDGQLYVAGLRGWQSNAAREGGFDRVRYTGAPVVLPTSLRATKTGVVVGFTAPLDAATAGDPDRWAVEAWNYKWTSGYGSGEFPVRPEDADTKGQGHTAWTVKSATVSPDGRSVTLEIPEIQPVMQMRIQTKIKAADGSPVSTEIHNTIHLLR